MTLTDFQDWLQTQIVAPHWTVGTIDSNQQQCIGLSNAKGSPPVIAIGGLANSSYSQKNVALRVRWGDDASLAEHKANEVYAALFGRSAVIGGNRVILFQMMSGQPESLGADIDGIYEYLIETQIYYER